MPPFPSAPHGGSAPFAAAPFRMELPPGVVLEDVLADLADGGVAAPALGGEEQEGLRAVVEQAAERGIDLKIIALDANPGWIPNLRDLANDVGAADGGTVLVMSPHFYGTYSDSLARIDVHSGELAGAGLPWVERAEQFLEGATAPGFPWTGMTLSIVAVIVVSIVFTRWWTRRVD